MNFLNKCSIHTGIATLDNNIFVTVMNDGLADERQQHAIPLFFKDDVWTLITDEPVLPWLVAGMDSIDQPRRQVVIVGWGGQVLVVEDTICHREAILRKDSGYVSIVRSVAAIDETIYTVGMSRQVHKRTGSLGWMEIDQDVVYRGDDAAVGFNAIDGFDSEEVYTAGLNGEIWRFDDHRWHSIQTPTNAPLHSLCCAKDGYVYIGGKSGILIRGRHDTWAVLEIDFEDAIWDIHSFRDTLYLLTTDGIYLYFDGNFKKIRNELLDYGDFQRISSSKDRLWVFGRKKIVQYDGKSWRQCNTVLPEEIDSSPVLGFFNDDVLVSGSEYLEE